MKNVDYIIVGDGYAALFFAHQLILNNKSFVVFSEQKKKCVTNFSGNCQSCCAEKIYHILESSGAN